MTPLIIPVQPETLPQCTLVDCVARAAATHPGREAIVCAGARLNWSEFDSRINRVANGLHTMGIEKGDRVAILASTSLEYAEIFMGVLRAGACLVPLPTLTSSRALQMMVGDCGATVFFLSRSMRDLAEPFIDDLTKTCSGRLIAIDFDGGEWIRYQTWMSSVSDHKPDIEVGFDDPFNIIYSSGTTGVPKGILHNHMMRATQTDRMREFGFGDETRTLISTPLYSNTTIVALLPTLAVGGTLVLMENFDAEQYLELVQKERCTHTMLVPVQYKRIMDVGDIDRFDLSSMTLKLSTSAPLRVTLKEDVLKRFPGGLVEIYGMTEGGVATVLSAHLHPDKLASVGQPATGVELRFIDDKGREVKPGQIGEICGRSPSMMSQYYGRDDLTKEALWHDDSGTVFYRSGDLGYMDDDGFVYLGDRKKDMIISGGLNIYANDLELALLEDEDVDDAAVIGIPSETWGETPMGFVVLRKGATRSAGDIRKSANERLGKSQRLLDVEIRQSLPRSQIGKILKRELRIPYRQTASQ